MEDKNKERSAGSRILRERAMKILTQTRAGMDPRFLEEMKMRFSALVPASPPNSKAEPVVVADEARKSAPPESGLSEPVDKEKISKIVLQYMKDRTDRQKH